MFLGLAVLAVQIHRLRMRNLSARLKTEAQMDKFLEKYSISKRESEVIKLMLKGKSNKEIEEALFISSHTVKNHIYRIYKKLKVQNRLELIRLLQKGVKLDGSGF